MNIKKFKHLFKTEFYDKAYKRWRIDEEKAGKDIIGDQYEKFREKYYQSYGFSIGNGHKVFGSSYNCDTVVKKGNDIVILEEDKANYVDSCFLGRAIQNATQVFNSCLKQGIPIPYFVISSSTKYNKYEEIYQEKIETIRKDLVDILNEKFIYLPLCEHDRKVKGYFETSESCFNLSDELIEKQNNFVKGLL
tara:strand:+ start:374 stop:949 length:576 start_codon:yes stop_codon:yes gene_type:complete